MRDLSTYINDTGLFGKQIKNGRKKSEG